MWLRLEVLSQNSGDAYLRALGRASAVSHNLEHNARFVLVIARMNRAYKERPEEGLDALLELVNATPAPKTLGKLVRRLQVTGALEGHLIAILRSGTEARNFIAHEASTHIASDKPQHRVERLARFDAAIQDLARADSLVSQWCYIIEEKPYSLPSIAHTYEQSVVRWIRDPLIEFYQFEDVHDLDELDHGS